MKQLFSLLSARLILPLALFLINVMIARVHGKTYLGQYNTVWAWLAMFQYLSLCGLDQYLMREVGANREDAQRYLIHSLLFVFLFSLLCAVFMAGVPVVFKYSDDLQYGIMIASLALPFTVLALICQSFFIAFQKINLVVIASITETVLFLLFGAAVLLKGYGILALILALVFMRSISSALNLYFAHAYIAPLRLQIDGSFVRKMLEPTAIFGITNLFYQLFLRIDIVMLSKLKDMLSVGLYSSASKLIEICFILPVAFYSLHLPVLAGLYKNFPEAAHDKIEGRVEAFFIIIFLVFGFGLFFAQNILGLIFGKSFVEAAWILRILIVYFLIWSAEIVLNLSCQAAGHYKIILFFVIIRVGINILLNLILIPLWGAEGAALSALVSVTISFFVFYYYVRRNLGVIRWIQIIKKPAAGCLITMGLLSPLLGHLHPIMIVSLFLLSYVFFVFAFNGFSLARARVRVYEIL